MKRLLILMSWVAVAAVVGCRKQTAEMPPVPAPEPAPATADATQTQPVDATQPAPVDAQAPVLAPSTADTNADAEAAPVSNLAQLTLQLHRWIGRHERLPKNFEEFAANCPIKIAPPPAGKKYAIDGKWKVILVNQ